MSNIIDEVFPLEQCQEDILGGYEDCTDGRATVYFKNLSSEDREHVQWYACQGLTPGGIEYYVFDLAKGYAIIDPNRTSQGGIEAAHSEVARMRRYVGLFVSCGGFFPRIERFNRSAFDEDGKRIGAIEITGWTELTSPRDRLEAHKEDIRMRIIPLLDCVDRFIDDPNGASDVFDQDRIVREHLETLTADERL